MSENFTYCQRDIEDESKCSEQCDHCAVYYAQLENDRLLKGFVSGLPLPIIPTDKNG